MGALLGGCALTNIAITRTVNAHSHNWIVVQVMRTHTYIDYNDEDFQTVDEVYL